MADVIALQVLDDDGMPLDSVAALLQCDRAAFLYAVPLPDRILLSESDRPPWSLSFRISWSEAAVAPQSGSRGAAHARHHAGSGCCGAAVATSCRGHSGPCGARWLQVDRRVLLFCRPRKRWQPP